MKLKTARIIFWSVFFAFICEIIIIGRSCSIGGQEIRDFEAFYPGACPNTLWTSADGDTYLVSDESGETLGATRAGGRTRYFRVHFYMRANAISIMTLNSIDHPYLAGCNHYLYGEIKCAEDGCVISYGAADDREQYFGKREGEASLSFTRSPLPAPFSFDDEASLNALPFR